MGDKQLPERIWATTEEDGNRWTRTKPAYDYMTEYVRADLIAPAPQPVAEGEQWRQGAGEQAIQHREQKVREEERNMLACTVKAMRDEWETKRNSSEPLSKLRNRYDAGFCAANEILAAIRRDSEQEGEQPK